MNIIRYKKRFNKYYNTTKKINEMKEYPVATNETTEERL